MLVVPPNQARDFPWTEADAMYLLLVRHAADLRKCGPGSPEEEQLDRVWNTIEAYEAKRWVQKKEAASVGGVT